MGQRFCTQCGAAFSEGQKFCTQCGAQREDSQRVVKCVSCGAPLTGSERFCTQCGALQDGAAAQPAGRSGLSSSQPAGTPNAQPFVQSVSVQASVSQSVSPAVMPPAPSAAWEAYPDADDQEWQTTILADEEEEYLSTTVLVAQQEQASILRKATGEKWIIEPPVTIGRGKRADCLVEGNTAISREHARISSDGINYVIQDLASANKTKINGTAISPDDLIILENGMTFALANEEFVFEIERS